MSETNGGVERRASAVDDDAGATSGDDASVVDDASATDDGASVVDGDSATDDDASVVDGDAVASLLGELLVAREDHVGTPAFVVGRDDVQAAMARLREAAGFDHCSLATAQAYEDRFETVYHLADYDDRRRVVAVVVPAPRSAPTSESAAPVYPSANWHEREAYDLVGVRYDGHPNLERILLPETWQGHPLRPEADHDQPQIVPLREHANPLAESEGPSAADEAGSAAGDAGSAASDAGSATGDAKSATGDTRTATDDGDTMFLNVGPHHPSTHGVLHLEVVLDGETVVDVTPDLGYIHRCEEQLCQQGTYRHQIMPYPDRWDWSGAGLCNEWAYARSVERLIDVDIPAYASLLRTMSAELSRILGHLLAVGTYALDVVGEFTAAFMYAIEDRERVQGLLEDLTGQRLMFNYFRVGGVAWDLPADRAGFCADVRSFVDRVPERLATYRDLLTGNELFQARTVDTGQIDADDAKAYGVTGPVARASGVDYDLRRDDPYGAYDDLEWSVVTRAEGDNFARLLVRLGEIRESARIVEQCVDRLESWPADERRLQANVPRTVRPERDAECYTAVEAAKGELGVYLRSDGTDSPARFSIRGPSFSNLAALPTMAEGETVPNLIATLGSLDTIMGEVDR